MNAGGSSSESMLAGLLARRDHARPSASVEYLNLVEVDWGDTPPSRHAYFIISPNQAHVPRPREEDPVRYSVVTDGAFRRVLIVPSVDCQTMARIKVISVRDRIRLLEVVFDDPPTNGCLPHAVEAACDRALRTLLDDRADACGWAAPPERRFFVQFDAWTRPELWFLLDDRTRAAALSPAAQKMFVDPCPRLADPEDTFSRIPRLAGALEDRTVDRVYFVRERIVSPPRGTAPSALDPGLTELVRRLATYLETIFDRTYPPCFSGAPSPAMIRSFALFARGMLRFLPCSAAAQSISCSCDDSSALNAEPEGAMFFSFAEFALEAARHSTDRQRYWGDLARAFTALQELYCSAYGPAVGPRRFDRYDRALLHSGSPTDQREVEALMAHYDYWYGSEVDLHVRLTLNAAWYLFDFDMRPRRP